VVLPFWLAYQAYAAFEVGSVARRTAAVAARLYAQSRSLLREGRENAYALTLAQREHFGLMRIPRLVVGRRRLGLPVPEDPNAYTLAFPIRFGDSTYLAYFIRLAGRYRFAVRLPYVEDDADTFAFPVRIRGRWAFVVPAVFRNRHILIAPRRLGAAQEFYEEHKPPP